MTYVQDSTMPGGWRYQFEKPVPQFIPQVDSDGKATGALIPSVPRRPDGTPVATTAEQVAALMELTDAEPMTPADHEREFQLSQAGLKLLDNGQYEVTAKTIEDEALRKQYETQAKLDPRVEGNELATPRAEPVTLSEQLDRVNTARRMAGDLGFGFRSEIQSERVAPILAGGNPQGAASTRQYLVVCVLNGNGSVAYGPATLMAAETWLELETRRRGREKRAESIMLDYQARQRAEVAKRAANTPEGRIAALERQLAEATGQPAPIQPGYRELMPGVRIGPVTVNDEVVS